MMHRYLLAISALPILLTGCLDTLPRTADEFNAAQNRLKLTEILLTEPEVHAQYNEKFWRKHCKERTDVWKKAIQICDSETATSPNCEPVTDVQLLCEVANSARDLIEENTPFKVGF